jgi:hypothetical protein
MPMIGIRKVICATRQKMKKNLLAILAIADRLYPFYALQLCCLKLMLNDKSYCITLNATGKIIDGMQA